MPSPESTRAIYVRMPTGVAEKLDRASEALGISKRDVLTTLVSDRLDIEGDDLRSLRHAGLPPTRIVAHAGPRAAAHPAVTPEAEVLSLGEAARLLRVPTESLEPMAESGEIPGRRIGGEWRFSREALLSWLRGD